MGFVTRKEVHLWNINWLMSVDFVNAIWQYNMHLISIIIILAHI